MSGAAAIGDNTVCCRFEDCGTKQTNIVQAQPPWAPGQTSYKSSRPGPGGRRTFTDSERHRQDPSTDALQTAAWPHDGQENPRTGPGTQALLGGHEPGRRSILRNAARPASPIRKSKNQSRSFGKEPEVLPRTRLSTKVSIETTRRVLLCHSSPPL